MSVRAGNQKATLSWDLASRATGYYIWQREVTFGKDWKRLPYPVNDDTFAVGFLVNGAAYEFKIQSVDGMQPGGYSNVVSVTPKGPTPRGPDDLTARGSRLGTSTLRWSTSSTATGYYIHIRNVSKGEGFKELPYPVSNGPWTSSYMTPGDTYEFRLQAVSGMQRGNYSNVARVTLPRPPGVSGVTVASKLFGVKVSWKGLSGADGYVIYYRHASRTGSCT
ncbi:fibronectin type III domain-containing protein [Actinomadura fulvescens]|uniref:Fibronectin type-III domain-containing protein n=1 Tax=Actinomadura fulvescens TaxID=46160 RepID=A0ABP6CBK5_9ACTN